MAVAVAVSTLDAAVEQDPIPMKLELGDDSSVSSAEDDSDDTTQQLLNTRQKKQLRLSWGLLRTICLVSFVLAGGGFFFYCLYLVLHFREL